MIFLLIPPAAVLLFFFLNRPLSRPFQLGLCELLLMPLAFAPQYFLGVRISEKLGFANDNWSLGVWIAFCVLYPVAGALLSSMASTQNIEERTGGWKRAIEMLLGAWLGCVISTPPCILFLHA